MKVTTICVMASSLALLTVQPTWGFVWQIDTITAGKDSANPPEKDTKLKYYAETKGELHRGTSSADDSLNKRDSFTVHTNNWKVDLGIEAVNWDYNSTPAVDSLEFDGVRDLNIFTSGNHLDPPHGEPANNWNVAGDDNDDRTASPNQRVRVMVSESRPHDSSNHRDRVNIQYRFRVKGGTSPVILLEQPDSGVNNIKIDIKHPGKDLAANFHPTGHTWGSDNTFVSYDAGSNFVMVSPDQPNILALNPTTTAGIAPEFATDPVLGMFLPILALTPNGIVNGNFELTPAFSGEISIGGGDSVIPSTSVLKGKLDTVKIDPVSGKARAHLATVSYSETFGEAEDNPSPFLGDLIDNQFFDPNSLVKEGMVIAFDALDLLHGSNNFTTSYESFSAGEQTTFTISGAAVPEPTTLALFTLASLALLSRRMN